MPNQFSNIDLTGQTFGTWTVIGKSTKPNKNYETYWECHCICGAVKNSIKSRLERRLACNNCRYEDLTGKRFGQRTVIKRLPGHPKFPGRRYLVRCDCGEEEDIGVNNLKKTASCGHCEVNRSIGKKYGKLTIIKRLIPRKKQCNCLVQCDCGQIKEAICRDVVLGNTTSCGCRHEDRKKDTIKKFLGKKIGMCKVIKYVGETSRGETGCRHKFLVRCKCGKEKVVDSRKFYHGDREISCGCIRNGPKGERVHSSKFTNSEARALREFYQSGLYSIAAICEMTGQNAFIIKRLLEGKTYKNA